MLNGSKITLTNAYVTLYSGGDGTNNRSLKAVNLKAGGASPSTISVRITRDGGVPTQTVVLEDADELPVFAGENLRITKIEGKYDGSAGTLLLNTICP